MTRVLHLSSAHPPFDTRVFQKECRTLAEAGYDVALAVPGGPTGVHSGVELIPVRAATSRLGRVTRTQRDLWQLARRSRADVIHLHDPDLLPMGWLLARRGQAVVYDSHEDVVRQLADRSWIPRTLRKPAQIVAGMVENHAVRGVTAVISAEPEAARRFPPQLTSIVQNYPLRREFENLSSVPYERRDQVVFYLGDITRVRGALQLVDAIALVPDDVGARLLLAGRINEPGLREDLERSPGWSRTDYLGFIDREQVQRYIGQARVGVVLMQPTAQYREATQPVKLFEYMGAGLPVVASDFPAWDQFVSEVGAGLQVDPTDTRAVAEAIEHLLRNPDEASAMGERGRKAVWSKWTWDTEAEALLSVYQGIVG